MDFLRKLFERESKHAKGHRKSPTWRAKRKKRQRMAKASRRRNRH